MVNKKNIYVLLLLPALLFGWGEDIYMFRSDDGAFPVSYDLTIPNDSLMFAAYRYNLNTDKNPYLTIYISRDTGKTWTYWNGFYLPSDTSYNNEETYLDYITDSLLAFFPDKFLRTAYAIKLPFGDSSGYSISSACDFSDLDTIFDLKFQNVYNTTDYLFYIAALGKSGDTTILEVKRSDDHGVSWNTVIRRPITYVNYIKLRLLDFKAASIASDSITFLYVESYHDTLSDRHAIYTEVWLDTIFGTPINVTGLFQLKQTGVYTEASADILGNTIVWAIADTGVLSFAWSNDNGNTIDTMTYPYQDEFSEISGLNMVSWFFLWSGGFDLIFMGNSTYGQRVWLQRIDLNGDSISFSEPPGIISDTSSYTYIFNLSPYYKPRIKYTRNLLVPGIMWHMDYYHLSGTPPFPFYDSTQFYFDYSAYTGIKEYKHTKSILLVKINGNTLLASSPALEGVAKIKIIDITGRVMANKVAIPHNNTVSTDITFLKHGIYFVTIETNNIQLKSKFVKLE